MNPELSRFAARLRELISSSVAAGVTRLIPQNRKLSEPSHVGCYDHEFNALALELFSLQFNLNADYRKICEARKLTPQGIEHWTQIPAVPAAAFKELELTSLAPDERTSVFHSSGTTQQKPGRHFHHAESLEVYEASVWFWFVANVATRTPDSGPARAISGWNLAGPESGVPSARQFQLILLTPPPAKAPHSSLVHMLEFIRQKLGGVSVPASRSEFFGTLAEDGSWTLDFPAVMDALSPRYQTRDASPLLLLGTAFSFVHLLDHLAERDLRFELPAGSRVMETGGYKNRSRELPKEELHALLSERLGITTDNIICEYGMSELSSQAYAVTGDQWHVARDAGSSCHASPAIGYFRFPRWARAQIVSPETGQEVGDGESGLIRLLDLANVFSVAAVQTADLGIRRGGAFELVGRAQLAEPRGCSLMTA